MNAGGTKEQPTFANPQRFRLSSLLAPVEHVCLRSLLSLWRKIVERQLNLLGGVCLFEYWIPVRFCLRQFIQSGVRVQRQLR